MWYTCGEWFREYLFLVGISIFPIFAAGVKVMHEHHRRDGVIIAHIEQEGRNYRYSLSVLSWWITTLSAGWKLILCFCLISVPGILGVSHVCERSTTKNSSSKNNASCWKQRALGSCVLCHRWRGGNTVSLQYRPYRAAWKWKSLSTSLHSSKCLHSEDFLLIIMNQ